MERYHLTEIANCIGSDVLVDLRRPESKKELPLNSGDIFPTPYNMYLI